MAKLTETVKIEVVGIDKVETLIELLSKHESSLPLELVDSLKDLADCDACEIGIEYLQGKGINTQNVKCEIDGVESKGVISANKVLKRVTMIPTAKTGKMFNYPERFKMIHEDGATLLEW